MAHRQIYSSSQMLDTEPDQLWNHLPPEEYVHHARTGGTETPPIFHPVENCTADCTQYALQLNPGSRLNGYSSSSQTVSGPHYQPDATDSSRESLHLPAHGNAFVIPDNHAHRPLPSNYGVESNFIDLSIGRGRGPYKRKSPEFPASGERGSSSRYYGAGSSSDISSSSEIRQEKTIDPPHSHWEMLPAAPHYRGNPLSIGGESSQRNVRGRFTLDLESNGFRNHLPSYPYHPSSSRLPVDHSGSVDNPNLNPNAPVQEWNPIHVSAPPHGRNMVSNHWNHETNRFYSGSGVYNPPGEMPRFSHEHVASRNTIVPPSMHHAPSHARVRNNCTYRSNPEARGPSGSLRVTHVNPDEGVPFVGGGNSTRYPRSFASVGWRSNDRIGRSRWTSERYRILTEDSGSHDRLTPEGHMIVDRSSMYGSRGLFDQHRDMRLDVDSMSYEELLALGERIGSVSTGLSEDQLPKCVTKTVYCSSDGVQEEARCVICLEEYQHMDDLGTLKACCHDYHFDCVKKWLSMKNTCPICKGPALPDNLEDK